MLKFVKTSPSSGSYKVLRVEDEHTLGFVKRDGSAWRVTAVNWTGSTGTSPLARFVSRQEAGEAIEREIKRAEREDARRADRNVPLALLSAIVTYCRQIEGFCRDCEQVGDNEFRVTFGSLRMTKDETYVLDRSGEAVR